MTNYLDNEIVLNSKIKPLVYIYIMILIICSLSLIIICMLYHYKVYYFFKGNVITEEDNYYLKCYIPISEIKYITSNNNLIINNKKYKYSIKNINEEYLSDNNNTYQEIILNIDLDNKYKHNNLILNLKLLKEDKTVIEYLKNIGGKK